VRTWSFSDGKWREGETVGAEFTWYDVTGAHDPGLTELEMKYSLHPLAIEDCRSTNLHAPKVDDFGDNLFVVLHAVVDPADNADTEELDIFLGKDFLITYQDEPSGTSDSQGLTPADSVVSALSRGIALRPGPDGLLYEIADRLVDDILPRVNALAEDLDTLQDEVVLKANAGARHQQILASRARAGRIRRILTPQLAVMQRLGRGEFALISEPNRVYFRDIYDHLVRIDLALEGLREDAEVALSTYLSAINNRLSEVMKVLAVVSALLLPGTVITGVFGTNFDNVPGLHSNWGFVIMVVSMLAIAVGMAWFFRRRHWF
jgi:magnesium transporter